MRSMYGIEFIEAQNALICGGADFILSYRDREKRAERYKLWIHPDFGMKLQRRKHEDHSWEEVSRGRNGEVISYLQNVFPKKSDFDLDWDWAKFMLALTFFDIGFSGGYDKGARDNT